MDKKGSFKRRMGLPKITEFAYDNIWDHLRHTDMHEYRKHPDAGWIFERVRELNERSRKRFKKI
jgi:hypothetical protein